jgi:hypothetical protein
MMKRFTYFLILLTVILCCASFAWAQTYKKFSTAYTDVYYLEDQDLDDFIWKLGGQRLDFSNESQLASFRIDRLIERVQTIIDMWPKEFRVPIFLHREVLSLNKVGYYDYQTKSLHFNVDYASEGVFAHELVHAVIDRYFPSAPPSKMQEILAQYVDEHVWSDY